MPASAQAPERPAQAGWPAVSEHTPATATTGRQARSP
jgi:hypothetical protein